VIIKKDYIVIGALVGIGADVIKLSANYTAKLLGFTPVVFWQLVATRFVEKEDLFSPLAYLIGGVADITVSALFGIAFVYFIYVFSAKFIWIKGIGFGLSIWVAAFGTLLGQSVQAKLPQSPPGIVVTIVAHFVFGLALALLTRSLHLEESKTTKTKQKLYRVVPEPARKAGDHTKFKKYLKS